MNAGLPALIEAFFARHLAARQGVSAHTIASYRDTFRLLLRFAWKRLGKAPSQLDTGDLDVALLEAFLSDLETSRRNTARSRNLRLTAIRSFFGFVSYEAPDHSALAARVLAMPRKRHERRQVDYLSVACACSRRGGQRLNGYYFAVAVADERPSRQPRAKGDYRRGDDKRRA